MNKKPLAFGWLLETAEPRSGNPAWYCWISNAQRLIVGFAKGQTETSAIRSALFDAAVYSLGSKNKRMQRIVNAINVDLFGTAGMHATAACANSGE